jgi:dCTP deaminase
MTILNDTEITELSKEINLITPFEVTLVKTIKKLKVISYGLSSYGYDIRLSPQELTVFTSNTEWIDPKSFDSKHLAKLKLYTDTSGSYFVIPGHSYALGVALEKINMPNYLTGVCIGKSTYARSGLIANLTPIEAGWSGYLTLELANTSDAPCKVYANEGIAQVLFFKGNPCLTSYSDRQGKYQNQKNEITLPKV